MTLRRRAARPAPAGSSRRAPSPAGGAVADRRGRGPRRRDDRGSAAAVELPFGILWVVATALVVLTITSWVEDRSAVRAAADEAARAMVTAPSWQEGRERAGRVVDEIEAAYGLDPGTLVMDPPQGSFTRGATITVTVRMTVGAVSLPMGLDFGSFSLAASHSEPVDQYRSL